MTTLRNPGSRPLFDERLRSLLLQVETVKSSGGGPQPQASQRLRNSFLNWHRDVEQFIFQLVVDAPDNGQSGVFRSLVEDTVPASGIYRAVEGEITRMLTYLERVERELHAVSATQATALDLDPRKTLAVAPKAFISHAHEDKDRFVVPFATRLRENGVDAWLDQWEIFAGDSIIDRIFNEGIGRAAAVLVILSKHSIDSRWVTEELNVATVRRINGLSRLIAVRLDTVQMPSALADSLYVDIDPPRDWEPQLEKILRAIFMASDRPALGPPPSFAGEHRASS
jgi:hypothetical protein